MIEFTIHGQCKSGKNHMQFTRSGRHYPLKKWAEWRDRVVNGLAYSLMVMPKIPGGLPLVKPLKIIMHYWREDNRKRDVPGMIDALFHCFERAGIVKDDSLFINVYWHDMGLDKENPRVHIKIEITE